MLIQQNVALGEIGSARRIMSQIFSMYIQYSNMYIYECLSILLCVIRSWTALSRALCQADWPA